MKSSLPKQRIRSHEKKGFLFGVSKHLMLKRLPVRGKIEHDMRNGPNHRFGEVRHVGIVVVANRLDLESVRQIFHDSPRGRSRSATEIDVENARFGAIIKDDSLFEFIRIHQVVQSIEVHAAVGQGIPQHDILVVGSRNLTVIGKGSPKRLRGSFVPVFRVVAQQGNPHMLLQGGMEWRPSAGEVGNPSRGHAPQSTPSRPCARLSAGGSARGAPAPATARPGCAPAPTPAPSPAPPPAPPPPARWPRRA